jgi:hypothetical protein
MRNLLEPIRIEYYVENKAVECDERGPNVTKIGENPQLRHDAFFPSQLFDH